MIFEISRMTIKGRRYLALVLDDEVNLKENLTAGQVLQEGIIQSDL
jgi:hypothetical protein